MEITYKYSVFYVCPEKLKNYLNDEYNLNINFNNIDISNKFIKNTIPDNYYYTEKIKGKKKGTIVVKKKNNKRDDKRKSSNNKSTPHSDKKCSEMYSINDKCIEKNKIEDIFNSENFEFNSKNNYKEINDKDNVLNKNRYILKEQCDKVFNSSDTMNKLKYKHNTSEIYFNSKKKSCDNCIKSNNEYIKLRELYLTVIKYNNIMKKAFNISNDEIIAVSNGNIPTFFVYLNKLFLFMVHDIPSVHDILFDKKIIFPEFDNTNELIYAMIFIKKSLSSFFDIYKDKE